MAPCYRNLDSLLELKVKIYQLFHQVIHPMTKNFSLHNNVKMILALLYPEHINNENGSTLSHSPIRNHNHDIQKGEKSSSVCESHSKLLFVSSLDELEGYLYPILLKSIQFSIQDDSDNDTTLITDHHLNICLQLTVTILNLLSTLCQTSHGLYYIRYVFPKADILTVRTSTPSTNNSTNGGNDGEDENNNNINDSGDTCKTCSGISIFIQIFDLAVRRQQERRHNQSHHQQQHDYWWNMILENCISFFNILSKHVTKNLRENEGITLSLLVQEQLLLFQAKCALLLVYKCFNFNKKIMSILGHLVFYQG